MRFLALDMGDETHATGIMLVGGVVQTLGLVHNHAAFGRMGFAGGLLTIPAFPCCLKCLEQRCGAAIRGTASAHLGSKPRKSVIDRARWHIGAKQRHAELLQQNKMDAASLCLLVELHQLLHALRRDSSYRGRKPRALEQRTDASG